MYITYKVPPKEEVKEIQPTQINFNDLFNNYDAYKDLENIERNETYFKKDFFRTHTKEIINVHQTEIDRLHIKYNVHRKMNKIANAAADIRPMLKDDMSEYYSQFRIPKRTGGFRTIDAPNEALKHKQRMIKDLFEKQLQLLPHNSAYAYVQGRSTVEALQQHQRNKSKWFLKIDIKDFFPSHRLEFIMEQLWKLFPLGIYKNRLAPTMALQDIVKLGLINNKLPQGTPMSPTITNLTMLPIDFNIKNKLQNYNRQHFVYTRYADDIIISSKQHFDWRHIQSLVEEELQGTPLKIKHEKTRYGSAHGRNWNLGLMLNKDNNITIGWRNREKFKAAIFSFLKDYAERNFWSLDDVYHLQGLVSYYSKVDKDMVQNIITKYENKNGVTYKLAIQQYLQGICFPTIEG